MGAMGHQKVAQIIKAACPDCPGSPQLTPYLTPKGAVYRCAKCEGQWRQKEFHVQHADKVQR